MLSDIFTGLLWLLAVVWFFMTEVGQWVFVVTGILFLCFCVGSCVHGK